MRCAQCQQVLPGDGQPCTTCALQRMQAINAGLKGGTIGLAAGLLGLSFFLGQDELSPSLKWGIMLMPLFLFVAGSLYGYVSAKRERKS